LKPLAVILLAFAAVNTGWAEPDPKSTDNGTDVISRYHEALDRQRDHMKNLSADVTMEASLPKLKKIGRLSALRRVSSLGRITYKLLGFSGDDMVKKEVMARYMTAEVKATDEPKDDSKNDISINEKNYKFKYKGLTDRQGQRVHVFELKPRKKRVGLFKGELWIDPETFLPVREAGRLVKNPSMFIKKMEFVRTYQIRDGVAYLVHMESKTDTRIVGRAELNIEFGNYHVTEPSEDPIAQARRSIPEK